MDITRLRLMGAVLVLTAGNVNGEGSGAAILKGLEKAESRLTEVKETGEVTDAVADEGTSDGEGYVSNSYICRQANLVRQITIEYPTAETGYACRVLYDSEKGATTPWYAKNERDYCEPRATGLMRKHLEMGWKCTGK